MTTRPHFTITDPDNDPRITTSEFARIAHLSPQTVLRRVRAGLYPKAIDKGAELIFDRGQVYEALGITMKGENYATSQAEDPWVKGAHAIARHPVTKVCRGQGTGRDNTILFPTPKKAPP